MRMQEQKEKKKKKRKRRDFKKGDPSLNPRSTPTPPGIVTHETTRSLGVKLYFEEDFFSEILMTAA